MAPGVYAVTVRATDSGTPALFAEDTFTVAVLPNLDADGNGAADAADGQIILRYLSGTPNAQLLTGVTLGSGATRTTPAAIRTYLDSGKTLSPKMLDADGNGQFSALTDGRLISRYLSGATGPALVGGSVIGAGATRTTAAAIAAYLDGFRPAVPLSPAALALVVASEPAVLQAEASGAPQPTAAASEPTTSAPQPLASSPAESITIGASPITSEPAATRSVASSAVVLAATTADPLVSGAPSTVIASSEHDLSIDWSRSWVDSRNGHGHQPSKATAWLKRLLLEFAEDDPNRGMEVVMAGHAPSDEVGHETVGARRSR